jgi:hypothetical protein
MIFIILLIYFIILIILEFFFICLSSNNKKKDVNIENVKNLDKIDLNKEKLKKINSDDDVNINNYIGKFLLNNHYGFYISLNNWNLLEPNKLYEFRLPVNIKIVKIKHDKNIEYLIN